jgi:hypothetical protein
VASIPAYQQLTILLHCTTCLPSCLAAHSLVSNSALISRYAALRAQALRLSGAPQLYGPSLTLTQPEGKSSSRSSSAVIGAGPLYESVAGLELRLSGTMGIEVGTHKVISQQL